MIALQLFTRIDGFADTTLQWRTDRGEKIPDQYVIRLTQPVSIGGEVRDADGRTVANAEVVFAAPPTDPATESRPESHATFGFQTVTDAEGRWRLRRIAPEVFRRVNGRAFIAGPARKRMFRSVGILMRRNNYAQVITCFAWDTRWWRQGTVMDA